VSCCHSHRISFSNLKLDACQCPEIRWSAMSALETLAHLLLWLALGRWQPRRADLRQPSHTSIPPIVMPFDAVESTLTLGNTSWNLNPEPHGQGSLRPSFSINSLSPWTKRKPRFTFVSDRYPRRRLELRSKAGLVERIAIVCHDSLPSVRLGADSTKVAARPADFVRFWHGSIRNATSQLGRNRP